MISTIAAIAFAVLMGIVVLFQFGLALGLPWGEASMGGKYPGKYPPAMRVFSLLNMMILSAIGIIVLVRADLLLPQLRTFSSIAIWFVVGFSVISTIMNLITPSKIERTLWAPTAVLLLLTSLVVALS